MPSTMMFDFPTSKEILGDNFQREDDHSNCGAYIFFGCLQFSNIFLSVVVVVVVVVVAVLRMHDSWATTFGSRCFNKSIQICFPTSGDFFVQVFPC